MVDAFFVVGKIISFLNGISYQHFPFFSHKFAESNDESSLRCRHDMDSFSGKEAFSDGGKETMTAD